VPFCVCIIAIEIPQYAQGAALSAGGTRYASTLVLGEHVDGVLDMAGNQSHSFRPFAAHPSYFGALTQPIPIFRDQKWPGFMLLQIAGCI
jgi:hypothetical protein